MEKYSVGKIAGALTSNECLGGTIVLCAGDNDNVFSDETKPQLEVDERKFADSIDLLEQAGLLVDIEGVFHLTPSGIRTYNKLVALEMLDKCS